MATTYNLISYDAEDERDNDPSGPPQANLFSAAFYVDALLTANNIKYAMMGGFAMICRGSQRNTQDIDVVVDASMRRLWEVVEKQPRLRIPNTRLIEGVLKIFVGTGPGFNDRECSEERWIDVDLMTPGFKGSPADLSSHQIELSVTFEGQQHIVPCLDILYMMRSKLTNCVSRELARDIDDIQFLLNNFSNEVSDIWQELDKNEVDEFLELDWLAKLPKSVSAHYQRTLGR